jgi:hypothetical protein
LYMVQYQRIPTAIVLNKSATKTDSIKEIILCDGPE